MTDLTIDLTASTIHISTVYDITVDGTSLVLHTRTGDVVIDRQVADKAADRVREQQAIESAAAGWVA